MLGIFASSETTSLARNAVAVKERAADAPAQLAERTAELNGRAIASRRAIAKGDATAGGVRGRVGVRSGSECRRAPRW